MYRGCDFRDCGIGPLSDYDLIDRSSKKCEKPDCRYYVCTFGQRYWSKANLVQIVRCGWPFHLIDATNQPIGKRHHFGLMLLKDQLGEEWSKGLMAKLGNCIGVGDFGEQLT